MPTSAEDAFAAELADLQRSFIRSLEPRIVRLRELLPASASAGWTPEARAEIQAIAHKLAGSCASFGLQTIGDAAMTLEDKLIDAKAAPGVSFPRDVEALIVLCACAIISIENISDLNIDIEYIEVLKTKLNFNP